MSKKVKVIDILNYLDEHNESYRFIGDKGIVITGFSSLSNYKYGNITWIKNKNTFFESSNVSSIMLAVVQEGIEVDIGNKILTNESKRIFFDIVKHFYSAENNNSAIGRNTYISPEVRIGNNVKIGHNCTLDGDIYIGDNTTIYNNVNIINRVVVGRNCEIQSGVNIGHDGFSYYVKNERKFMIKHYGGVYIGDNVHIGTNTSIARGTIDDTTIDDNCKIDNLCHIAHNAQLGKNVTLIAGTIIYGSVQIGNNAYIATGIVRNQLSVGDKAMVGMGSVVIKDVPSGELVIGIPAKAYNKRANDEV